MRNVIKIIDLCGGLEALKANPIRLQAPGFMPLTIEYIGTGPNGFPLVSVCHYGEQNGDLMRDPDVVFELAVGQLYPVSIRNDYVGTYREAVFVGEDGKIYVRPAVQRDIRSFARIWDRNLKHQGFVDAAKRMPRANEDHGRMCKCDDCQQRMADDWEADEDARKHDAVVASGEIIEAPQTDLF